MESSVTAASISSQDPILIYAKEAHTSQIKKSQEIKKVLGLRWIDLEGDGLIQLEPEGNGSGGGLRLNHFPFLRSTEITETAEAVLER